MSPRNHKGYLRIEGSLIIKFVIPLILSVNDVTIFLSLNMRNIRDIVLISSNRDWPEFPCYTYCHGSEIWWPIQVCVDYRALHECSVKDSFPLPRIDYLLDKLLSAKCMTHLGLRSAHNQVRMSDDGPQDESIVATAFQGLTPNGESCLLEMLVMG